MPIGFCYRLLAQDFYASYDELTKSPVPVPISSRDGRMNTVWVDGNRLVTYIRDRMLSGLVISRVPLLLHELRSGDRSTAAREIAGDPRNCRRRLGAGILDGPCSARAR